jgi:hypothetical protein
MPAPHFHSHGGVVGLRKLVLGQWCWGPRPALLAASGAATEEEAKAADAIPLLHPLRQLLAAPSVAGTLEELDLLQARLLPGEIEVRKYMCGFTWHNHTNSQPY